MINVTSTTKVESCKPINIDNIVVNPPEVKIKWTDGTETVSKCRGGSKFDLEKGVAICFMKKFTYMDKCNFDDVLEDARDLYREYIAKGLYKAFKQIADIGIDLGCMCLSTDQARVIIVSLSYYRYKHMIDDEQDKDINSLINEISEHYEKPQFDMTVRHVRLLCKCLKDYFYI